MNPLQVPQKGPYKEGSPLTGNFAYLSKTSSFGFPSKGALPETPSTEPLERAMPQPQSPFVQLSKSPVDQPSLRFPKRSPYEKRCPSPVAAITYKYRRFIYVSLKEAVLEAHPKPLLQPHYNQSTIRATLQPINTKRLKICWPLRALYTLG